MRITLKWKAIDLQKIEIRGKFYIRRLMIRSHEWHEEIVVFFFFISCVMFSFSCEKYEEDSGIQWHKPNKRLQDYTWVISKYMFDQIDSTEEKNLHLDHGSFWFFVGEDPRGVELLYKNTINFATWSIQEDGRLGIGVYLPEPAFRTC